MDEKAESDFRGCRGQPERDPRRLIFIDEPALWAQPEGPALNRGYAPRPLVDFDRLKVHSGDEKLRGAALNVAAMIHAEAASKKVTRVSDH